MGENSMQINSTGKKAHISSSYILTLYVIIEIPRAQWEPSKI
jgi:hypothetical protein